MSENQPERRQQLPTQAQSFMPARHLEEAASLALRPAQFTDAINCMQEAIIISPKDPHAYLTLGYLLLEQAQPEEALSCYQKGIAQCPGHADLWFHLGTLLLKMQRLSEAASALEQTVALKPDLTDAYMNWGSVLEKQDLLEEALTCYQKGITQCPGSAVLWFNFGTILLKLHRLPEADNALKHAVSLKPNFVDAYMNWGSVLEKQDLPEEALSCYQKGITKCPGSADLWFNLGTTLLTLQRLPEANNALKQAITLQPDFADAYMNWGSVLEKQGLPEEALTCYQKGVGLCPESAELWYNLGTTLLNLRKLPEAVTAFKQAITLNPGLSIAYTNLGFTQMSQGEAEEAIAAYSRAIVLNPTEPEGYGDRSLAILLSGNLPLGFAEYEWRTKLNRIRHFYDWCNTKPRWCGENFSGKRLLVHHEQGFGDVIQFIRYLPLVKAQGGMVLFSTKNPLLRLFAHFPGIDMLIEHTPETIAQTPFDLAVPLLSLPYIFGTTLATIPANVPYLTVEPNDITAWQNKMNDPAANFRVGLVWGGSSTHNFGHIRDCSLKAMSSLTSIPGITFYSIQKGEAAKEAITPPQGMQLINLTDDIEDFADTAAFILNLDLVIAVDTAVAHLTGSLGKPVWTLLSSSGEWRWLLTRKDSPWYPSMRLFRQPAPGDWASVMAEVGQELKMLLAASRTKDMLLHHG